MSSSDAKQYSILHVDGPLGVSIQVMDGKLRTVATGAGRLSKKLPEGIYTVRWLGPEPEERTVRLFATATPLAVKGGGSGQTFGSISLAEDAILETVSSQRQSTPLARVSKPVTTLSVVVEQREEALAKADPARSLRIMDAQRREVARWQALSGKRHGRLEAALPPGTYVIRFKSTGDRSAEQTVVVVEGYQTVVRLVDERGYEFRGRDGHRTRTAIRGIDPAQTVILSVRLGSSSLPDRDISRARTLLRGLNAQRTLLDELLVGMSARDQDPYMRLYCGLLVAKALREDRDGAGWASGAADQIAGSLPREFDADGAGLRCGLGQTDAISDYSRIAIPPMLAIGWRWLVESTLTSPSAIVGSRMTNAASDAPSAFLPWLVWYSSAIRRSEPGRHDEQVPPEDQLRQLIEQILAESSLDRGLDQGSFSLQTQLRVNDNLSSMLKPDTSRFLSDLGHLWNGRSVRAVSELAGNLGLPAGGLFDRAEQTLEELRAKRSSPA